MKQTSEEAAHSFAESRSSGSAFPAYYQGFVAGAEWHARQSPWISVKERLPENKDEVLVLNRMNISGRCFVSEDSYDGKEWAVSSAMHYIRVAWMPIPSFDEILEANRDVLERIKEKGD